MRAGTLNTRVTIERKTGGTNDWGEPLPEGWEDFTAAWANVLHKSGSETIRADADTSTVRASVRIRWRTDVDAGMRLKVGAAVYVIEAVLPDLQRREFVDLIAKLET